MANKPGPTIESIRWTPGRAAEEFRVGYKLVTGGLKKSGELAGEDGCFSTIQVANAIYGDMHKQKLRLATEAADAKALANDEARGRLVDKPDLLTRFQTVFAEMKGRILNSELSQDRKDALLNSIASLEK